MGKVQVMGYPEDTTHLINAYKNGQILIATWHRGESSAQMEVEVFQERMTRGEVDYIIVHDRDDVKRSYKLYPNGVKVSL